MNDGTKTFLLAIGASIHSKRRERELSMRKLAQLSKLNVSTISRLEKQPMNLRLETLYMIADALGVPGKSFLP